MNSLIASVEHELRLALTIARHSKKMKQYDLARAREEIAKLDLPDKESLLRAYTRDYRRYRATFDEYYYFYQFYRLSDAEKREFLTMRRLQTIIQKYMLKYGEQSRITGSKPCFLKTFSPFIKRKWMRVDKKSNPREVQAFLDSFDVIAKPTGSSSGTGVYKIMRGHGRAEEILNGKLPILLEQCISSEKEIAAFHPASLNTVRLLTLSNGKDVSILGAALKTGNNGSVFDNAAASGGYFAEINPETGVIISDGITVKGVESAVHPVSGKMFMGFEIPRWHELIETCRAAALFNSRITLVAWDFAVTPQGIEIIEANSIPSPELHQMPLHKGISKKMLSTMDELGLSYRDALFWAKILWFFI